MWNQLDYRPLEGFVYAVTPFNFTSIGGNLPTAPALMGNTVIWKPASTAMLSAYYIMKLLEEAGLPPGVINFVPGDPVEISNIAARRTASSRACTSPAARASSTACGRRSARTCRNYATYPRIVGETGGKDFIVAHPSADRAGARRRHRARRVRVPGAEVLGGEPRLHPALDLDRRARSHRRDDGRHARWATSRDFRNFMGAVIDEKSFKKISGYLDDAKQQRDDRQRRRGEGRRRATSSSRRSSRRTTRAIACCARRSSDRS